MRRTVRVAAAAALTAMVTVGFSAPSAQAVAIDPDCLYGLPTPTMSLGLSTTAPTAGQPVYVKGRLKLRECNIPGRPIAIFANDVQVSSKTKPPRTDSFGYYAYRLAPLASTKVRATSSVEIAPGVVQSAASRTITLSVRTNLRARVTTARACRVKASGTTYPLKRGATIYLQRRITRKGKFVGWSTIATAKTGSTGAWAATAKLPCGSRIGISAYIKAVSGNAAGRTPTVTVTVRR
jgi:hypothetical protein